jgi:tellurite methyltransferase
MKNIEIEKKYWSEFYKKFGKSTPSQFCISVIDSTSNKDMVIEFGMGNGRDALFFSSNGYGVIGVDLSEFAVNACNDFAVQNNMVKSHFYKGDISNKDVVEKSFKKAGEMATNKHSNLIIYSRFVMHSLSNSQESDFLFYLSKYMKENDRLYFEFRTKEDEEIVKYYGIDNHYRRYVNLEEFCENLCKKYRFKIEYKIMGNGMAKYKDEDPFVARITAVKL